MLRPQILIGFHWHLYTIYNTYSLLHIESLFQSHSYNYNYYTGRPLSQKATSQGHQLNCIKYIRTLYRKLNIIYTSDWYYTISELWINYTCEWQYIYYSLVLTTNPLGQHIYYSLVLTTSKWFIWSLFGPLQCTV